MKSEEREIRFKDCHVGDKFKLDVTSPFVQYYLKDSEKDDEIIVTIIETQDFEETIVVEVRRNGLYEGTSWLEEYNRFAENYISYNLKPWNIIKKRKNNCY